MGKLGEVERLPLAHAISHAVVKTQSDWRGSGCGKYLLQRLGKGQFVTVRIVEVEVPFAPFRVSRTWRMEAF